MPQQFLSGAERQVDSWRVTGPSLVKDRSFGNASSDVSQGISSNRDRQIKKEAKQKANNLASAVLLFI